MAKRNLVDEVLDIGMTLDDIRIGISELHKSLQDDPENPANVQMADEVVRECFAITGRLAAVSRRVRVQAGGGLNKPMR